MTGRYFEVDPHQPPIESCVKHLSYFLKNYEEILHHEEKIYICHRCGSRNVEYNHVCTKTDKERLRLQRIVDADFKGQPTGAMVVFAMVALAALVAFGWWIRGCSL
jgi:ribosomal protein L40E